MTNLHPITLAFRRDQAQLEPLFLQEHYKKSLPILRLTCVVSLIVYAAFGILDAYLFPENTALFWFFRYAVFLPFCLIILLASFTSFFKRYAVGAIVTLEILAGSGIIMMVVLAPAPFSHSYYAGIILVYMIGYTLVRQRFIWATLAGGVIAVGYEIAMVYVPGIPVAVLINNNFFIIGANVLGMVACYTMEYSDRQDFFLKRLLEAEKQKVRRGLDVLEDKVGQRTVELEEANRLLTEEIAERQEVQSQLLRHQKMESIGLVVGGVAHDLNNILAGVIAYPEIILTDLPADSPLRPPLEEILKSGKRAAYVVNDLLTVARGVARQQEVLCLNDLVQEYLFSPEYTQVSEQHPEVVLTTDLADKLDQCFGSPLHLQKVIMNLVNNGFESIEGKGAILITTGVREISPSANEDLPPGRFVWIRIADTGAGIPADSVEHIFEPYYTRKRLGRSGSGLGLAVVWNTVQEHCGTIDVKSDDSGTTFTVYLPVTTKKKQPVEAGDDLAELHGTGSVLIIDDEKAARNVASSILTMLGYGVCAVSSGEEALEYLQDRSVDLLILDMVMDPGMSGLQTYQKIIVTNPAQKAILVSGFSESADAEAIAELGVTSFLGKPYRLRELGRAVQEILEV